MPVLELVMPLNAADSIFRFESADGGDEQLLASLESARILKHTVTVGGSWP
jgi:hypothetical protein